MVSITPADAMLATGARQEQRSSAPSCAPYAAATRAQSAARRHGGVGGGPSSERSRHGEAQKNINPRISPSVLDLVAWKEGEKPRSALEGSKRKKESKREKRWTTL